jgi:ABC-type phosphate transport system ATPase subunit
MERLIPYLKKIVFLAFKTLLSPSGAGEKTFFSTLNIMILQTVRNECVRFGGHVDIEVSYKILRLDVLKETPSL